MVAKEDQGNTVLAVDATAKGDLPTEHYQQDRVH